ncbi:hypothetical protein OOZ63_26215 [Paucibacter sp. PLA-PC-4]|uniref:hypothetical protein n=1 Tax=Paucibacter sp. PLA-PC-4 TaxID=2993655 RepID=UPI00224B5C72|nr:hypothetical protein [Paucibacter sp. PLA-PC-4]MCX2865325.1 hypothetical protein [Paucibacter sp. PLA-PC-4]
MTRKRDEPLSYISLVFRGNGDTDVLTAGLCVFSTSPTTVSAISGCTFSPVSH